MLHVGSHTIWLVRWKDFETRNQALVLSIIARSDGSIGLHIMNPHKLTQQRRDDFMAESMSTGDEKAVSRFAARTRAISIKRSDSCSNDEYYEITDRANYDMATWRMYNRILNHRMMRQRSEGSSSSSEDEATIVCEEEYKPPKRAPQPYFRGGLLTTLPRKGHNLNHWASSTFESDDEEGIFQLDL